MDPLAPLTRCGSFNETSPHTMTSSIRITSPSPNEVLTYPLAIIRGAITSANESIYVSTPSHPPSTAFPIRNHAFTALYLLSPGLNHVRISTSSDLTSSTIIKIHYRPPPTTPPYIRLIHLLTSDSDGSFQSPSTSPQSYDIDAGTARLQTAGLLIQSAAAEMMNAHKLQRRTFRLAPKALVYRLPITTAEAHRKVGHELWSIIAKQLVTIPNRNDIIDLAVMSFTRMTPSGVKAHTALGGGPLALFGGGSLFTWPSNLWEIPERFLDFRAFDDKSFFDDSAFRMKLMGRRACAATTIGALLHELGHCFSLPHPFGDAAKNGGGIMARGFDWFDRLFVQSDEQRPFWDRGSALRLQHHRFFKFEEEPERRRLALMTVSPSLTPMPQASIERNTDTPPWFDRGSDGELWCHSAVGIGHIGYYRNGDNAAHEEFDPKNYPRKFRLPKVTELKKRCQAMREDKLVISAIDVVGRITDASYEDM